MVSIKIKPKAAPKRRDVSDPEIQKQIWDAAGQAARAEVRANVRRALAARHRHAH